MNGYICAFICCFAVTVSSDSPVGHMKPFGGHRPPSVIIDEFTKETAPRPEEFYENYVKHSKAAIFRGGITDSRAFKYWTDEYVRENFGEMEVRLEGKHEKKHVPPIGEKYLGRDTIRHFIDHYHEEDSKVYVVSDLPQKMYKDMGVIPSVGVCGEMSRNLVEINLWWSGGGSSSIIHKDAYHQINCLLNGTKYWKLIEYKYEKDIYKHPEPEYELGGFSDLNPAEINLKRYPKVAKVEWSNLTINAGDCLYLPKSYYHQVESTGTHNMAVSLLISRFDNKESLDFSDCTAETDYSATKSLADFDVQLIWKGTGSMVMGRWDLEDGYRTIFLNFTEDYERKGAELNFAEFLILLDENPPDMVTLREGDLETGFNLMDRDGDGVFTNKEARELTLDELRRIADQIEPFEPSNNYEFEYSIISFDKVWKLMRKCLTKYKILTGDKWIRHYKSLGGTAEFGSEVFDRLSGDNSEILTESVSKDDLFQAMANWVKYWAPQYSELKDQPTLEMVRDDWSLIENGDHHEDDNYDYVDLEYDDDSQNVLKKVDARMLSDEL